MTESNRNLVSLVHPKALEYLVDNDLSITNIINSKNYNEHEIKDASIFTNHTLVSVRNNKTDKESMLTVNDFSGKIEFFSPECIRDGNLFTGIDLNGIEKTIEEVYLGKKVMFDSINDPTPPYDSFNFTSILFVDMENSYYQVVVKAINGNIINVTKV